jgi:hypothetical protein
MTSKAGNDFSHWDPNDDNFLDPDVDWKERAIELFNENQDLRAEVERMAKKYWNLRHLISDLELTARLLHEEAKNDV